MHSYNFVSGVLDLLIGANYGADANWNKTYLSAGDTGTVSGTNLKPYRLNLKVNANTNYEGVSGQASKPPTIAMMWICRYA